MKNRNPRQKWNFSKNRTICAKSKFFNEKSKLLLKIYFFMKNRFFFKKRNICAKSKLFVKNRIFYENFFSSKIEIFVNNLNFEKLLVKIFFFCKI